MKVWSLGFRVKIVLLSQAIGSVSNGNLSVFDIISSKGREILGDDIVTIGNEELPEITPSFFRHQTSIALYSTDIVVILSNFGIWLEHALFLQLHLLTQQKIWVYM